ncbi:MAG: hypothetical protein HQL68_10655, partial [Magnetococcales bacterium]|nr:hypothetical protein [Magnetococcales bacterium]
MSIAETFPKNPNLTEIKTLDKFIVSQDWLESNLQDSSLRIIQVGGEKYFNNFHIPGALLLSYNTIIENNNGATGARANTDKLIDLFSQLGIGPQTKVLAYDLAGGTDSARLIWTLATMGHMGGGMILDGGLGRWYEEKRPMEAEVKNVSRVEFISQPDSRWEISADEVDDLSQMEWDGAIIDVRSDREYSGNTMKAPRGHIKGAVHFEWSQTLRGPRDMRLLESDQIRAMLK